jgi:hypothetical protein
MESILLRRDAVSVGKQFLMFQRITVPSFSGVQKAAIVSFDTNEPATQRHIPQELILFGEFISYSEKNAQYTILHCMGKMQNS